MCFARLLRIAQIYLFSRVTGLSIHFHFTPPRRHVHVPCHPMSFDWKFNFSKVEYVLAIYSTVPSVDSRASHQFMFCVWCPCVVSGAQAWGRDRDREGKRESVCAHASAFHLKWNFHLCDVYHFMPFKALDVGLFSSFDRLGITNVGKVDLRWRVSEKIGAVFG